VVLFRGHSFALRRWALAAVLLIVNASAGVGSAFSATTTVADWEMNEPAGARTMRDSSGSNLSGTIGSAVQTGVTASGAKGYRWSSQNKAGHHPERLVTVQSSRLNPGTGGFAVTVRFSTGAGDQNILQKGQSTTAGGMYKIDMVKGFVYCTFKGSSGRAAVGSRQTVWNHAWHTIRCERRSTGVTITVDGGTPRTKTGATGNIANTKPLAIGGKAACNGTTIQCDYFVGFVDRAVVQRL
jgi:laminin G domain protein